MSTMKELPKAYEPHKYEDKLYQKWEDSGLFNPDTCIDQGVVAADADTFSIVLPPPNVTGTLHMGHAAMLAIEDVMVRYNRMCGKRALWVPGTDHAAVATESKVEKMLIDQGIDRPKETLGREAFLEKVQAFAQESHDTIVRQAKKMGASLDWSREAYTLDETRSTAVRMVFKRMYEDGLIYRGYRVVNWSVKGQSTCSDDELVYKERQAKMYYFKYHKDFPITIATTRPETKVGDTAVAVHPEGKWKAYIGQEFEVQDVGQSGHTLKIKVIGDEHIDEEVGTGALGVTPAHSMVDFEMYERHKALGNDIGLIQVIGEDGRMTANAGPAYQGKTVKQAHEQFVQYLREQGLLEKEEEVMQSAGTSDRFKDVVEPLPKTQWFIDVNKPFDGPNGKTTLKEQMQQAVRGGDVRIMPDRFEKTYFHWIDNLRDWCISRQIWFGHQIPVWYKGEETYCGIEAPEEAGWEQDPDTLDTWFSSGLWTFTTLLDTPKDGESLDDWMKRSEDMKYHPTTVLETGYDILFFWVARMILMTTYVRGEVPFKTVYLHGLVRDEKGRKMSKSIGNIINPLEMIEKFGTDATRLSLLVGGSPGNDMKLSEAKVEGFRNFANKLWNISRFMLLNIEAPVRDVERPTNLSKIDRWILAELDAVAVTANSGLEEYDLSLVGERLREFTWSRLADQYLEYAKIEGNKSQLFNYLLNAILKLWHPFMPFVTEAIWQEMYDEEKPLMVESYPQAMLPKKIDEALLFIADDLPNMISAIWAVRAQKGVPAGEQLDATIISSADFDDCMNLKAIIMDRARLRSLDIVREAGEKASSEVSLITGDCEVWLELTGAVDLEKERARLQKEVDRLAPYIAGLIKKLQNKQFVDNAPHAVVEQEKEKLVQAEQSLAAYEAQLKQL